MTPADPDTTPEPGGESPPLAVALDGVSVRFGGPDEPRALRDVDLRVRRGERVALLGPSGAGKSTLLALVSAKVRPTVGSVHVLGSDLDALSGGELRRLRSRVGTLTQSLDLVGPLRVVHNVNAGRLASWSIARSAWSLVRPSGVAEAEEALARVGLADRVFDRCEDLSGGEQQRVALARLLLQRPQLVLADEPVSSLDPALAAHVLDLLTATAAGEGRTLITSLHDPALAERSCDRLVGLRDGRVVFDTPARAFDRRLLDDLYGGRTPAPARGR